MSRKICFYTLVFLLTLSVTGCLIDQEPRVILGTASIKVQIAKTDKELEQGLQYRDSLPKDQGMLFVFPQDVQANFWMKNTLIPLDIIWITENKKVVHIEKNVPPCLQEQCPTYGPTDFVRYVLEANAGFADANDIVVGNQAAFSMVEKKTK